ncbi:MAG: alpha/beta fold hydrolase [Bacilli bacterium]|nr:alpha/beta fold hydrolase [Bacilli bacterium]
MLFRKAILIIHGFAGGTYDEEYLAHRLELIKNFDVYTFTLAGHDGLFKSNMKEEEWIKCTDEMIEFLIKNGYNTIYIIGHSMGGVIASIMVNKYKQIKKIVLVAAAFRYLSFKDDNFDFFGSLKKAKDVIHDYSSDEVVTRLLKMPLAALHEFANLIGNNQTTLTSITIPTLIIQGNTDNMVPMDTAEYIYNNINSKIKEILVYDGVNHDVFRSDKKEQITNDIIKFLKNY